MHRHQELFEFVPKDVIAKCVEQAFENLKQGSFGSHSIQDLTLSKQVICGIFHELIVNEISTLPDWNAGKQSEEADLVHCDGMQLQVKTSSKSDGIAGNRYSSQNEYSNPSEFYICVNFTPFECITKIRAGFVDSTGWKPQTGKGNAATLNYDVLNELPFLPGKYIGNIKLNQIKGIGKVISSKLGNLSTLNDLNSKDNYIKAKSIIPEKSMLEIDTLLSQAKSL